MKLTSAVVNALALPPGKIDHIEWDDDLPGFGVRLRGEARRYIVQYRAGGRQRRESLGDIRKVKLDDARAIARKRFARVELGEDPGAEREKAAGALTLAAVSTRYLDAKAVTMRPSSYKAAERYLRVLWKPLHHCAFADVKRADVAARLQELVKAHGRTAAGRARDFLSALYSWAMREGLTESNPVFATNDPTAGIPPRDRVLSDDEIRVIWRTCGDDDFGRIVRLLLLSGCRREEIGALKWGEIDAAGLLAIPGSRTKNRRAHELVLPPLARALLPLRRGDREYVFGRRDSGYCGWSAGKLTLDARIVMMTGKPLAPWRLHDLRRTMRTGLGRLKVAPHVAELAINHVKGGVEAIYDRHRYRNEIKTALARWARHVEALVEGRRDDKVALRA